MGVLCLPHCFFFNMLHHSKQGMGQCGVGKCDCGDTSDRPGYNSRLIAGQRVAVGRVVLDKFANTVSQTGRDGFLIY